MEAQQREGFEVLPSKAYRVHEYGVVMKGKKM